MNLIEAIESLESIFNEGKEITVQELHKELVPILGKAQVRIFDNSLLYTYKTNRRDDFIILHVKIVDGQYAYTVQQNQNRRVKNVNTGEASDLKTLKGELKALKQVIKTIKITKNALM